MVIEGLNKHQLWVVELWDTTAYHTNIFASLSIFFPIKITELFVKKEYVTFIVSLKLFSQNSQFLKQLW